MRLLRKLILALFIFSCVAGVAGAGVAYWFYLQVTSDLPDFDTIDDYKPDAVSKVYARDGSLLAEFFKEKRYPVKLQEIPVIIRHAFLASEDESFYRHQGIDFLSILRAAVKNFQSGTSKQGGSTITQQVVKNLLLTSEKKLTRKVKEAVLAYRLERRLSKDGILEIYLNQIFFGNTAYGIKAAAQVYFHKGLDQITLAEAAILAGLPKAPSEYSPIRSMEHAKRRQAYVLAQMVQSGFATQKEADQALQEKVKVYKAPAENIYSSQYYVNEVRRMFKENPAWNGLDIDTAGLSIYTALDPLASEMANDALRKGVRAVDKRRGWRGPIDHIQDANKEEFLKKFESRIVQDLKENSSYPALVMNINKSQGLISVDLGNVASSINIKESTWTKKKLGSDGRVSWIKPEEILRVGDVIEVTKDTNYKQTQQQLPEGVVAGLKIDQTPELEGAIVLLNPNNGEVHVTAGGLDYSKSQFNRVTQSFRQPGSSFKPIVYFTAVDKFAYTPATIVDDRPATYRVGDEYWTPQNFDEKFLGPITLQKAIEQSRNLVSVQIASKIGLKPIIEYAKKLGINSPMGRNLSLALGSSEVNMLELARAYGVFAAKGIMFDSVFITRIVDRDGKELFNYDTEKLMKARQVADEKSAFLMTNMLRGVVERGTASAVKALGRPAAGKTGTTNDQMDAWYVGFTPSWVCGVWVGFDLKKEIGDKETGGRVSAPIWVDFMKPFLERMESMEYDSQLKQAKEESERLGLEFVIPERLPIEDFVPPPGVHLEYMNLMNGTASSKDAPGAVPEYFIDGTGPNEGQDYSEDSYDDSGLDEYQDGETYNPDIEYDNEGAVNSGNDGSIKIPVNPKPGTSQDYLDADDL